MNNEHIKKTYIIANDSKTDVINYIKNTITGVQYEHSFSSIEQAAKPGLLISEDSLRYNRHNGLKIKRMRKKFLILCKSSEQNNKYISNIRNTYGAIIDIYIETIDDIYKYIERKETDTFAFRNLIFDLFKNYKNTDYLIII